MSRPGPRSEPSAVELIEEAVHLVRRAPASALATYYFGAVPFVLALLFFWAHTTWFRPSGASVAWSALGLALLFGLMKALQSEFCGQLRACHVGQLAPAWSWRRFGRVLVVQTILQPWALIAVLISLVIAVPFGWVYAYAQAATAVGAEEGTHRRAVAAAKLWSAQNHVALLLFSGVALLVWMNLAAGFGVIPWLANRLLGIESVFGFSGWSVVNSTFLASVSALTWLVVDPVIKAFYTLWEFHGRARHTGDDIRIEFDFARPTAVRAVAVALLLVVGLLGTALPTIAAGEPPKHEAIAPTQLNRAIDDVLTGPDFTWRMPPVPEPPAKETSAFGRFFEQGRKWIIDALKGVGHSIGRVVRWLVDWLSNRKPDASPSSSGGAAVAMAQVLVYGLIAIIVGLLLWIIWIVARQMYQTAKTTVVAEAVAAAAPDLRDENVQAAQLPVDGWLAMAREQAARGEWRLALRALYLATLARLAGENLISLARFKTNLDYERELRRRALSRTEVVSHFSHRRRTFEEVWYGRVIPTAGDVEAWLREFEGAAK